MRAPTHDPYRAHDLRVPQLQHRPDKSPEVAGSLRVCAVVDRYPPWINAGAEWMLHSILRRLVEHGHECRVSTALPDHVTVPAVVDGVYVYPRAADEDLVEWADVLIGHLLWTRDIVTIAARRERPLLYLMHNDQQIAHWNLTAPNVTVMVWNSEWVRDVCAPKWVGPSFVCRPPVFVDDYALDGVVSPQGFITLVNPIPEKGAFLFYALAQRRHRDKFLAVTGAYGHQHRPPHYINNVEMIPPTTNMRDDVYARSRVVLVPSSYESWGRVAVEAMAAGVPVVAHPTAGLVESCGDAAWFVDRDDVDGWMAALDALADPGTWWEWSARGRSRAAALEAVTDGDLDEFEMWVRRCAAVSPSRTIPPTLASDAERAVP